MRVPCVCREFLLVMLASMVALGAAAAPPSGAQGAAQNASPAAATTAPQGAAENPAPTPPAASAAAAAPPQNATPSAPATPSAAAPQNAAPLGPGQVDAIRILYTGKTMGYFRVPDWQAPTANGEGCQDPARRGAKSDAAAEFDELMQQEFKIGTTRGAILLSTGDNFSPEIEARDFCDPPPGQPGAGHRFAPVGKELFDWDAGSRIWVRSDAHDAAHPVPANDLFMVPTDNIANFFIHEGYAAIVPGKQDFYFGPERVRELARYMATQPIADSAGTLHNSGKGVQMLGANLVIETKWKTGHAPLPDSENPPWFIPYFPAANDLLGDAAGGVVLRMSGVTGGGTVYPWLRGVTLDLTGPNAAATLKTALDQTTFYLCGVDPKRPGIPNAIPQPVRAGPCTVLEKKAGAKSGEFALDFPWIDEAHYYTLTPGANYGLCAVAASARVKAADGSFTFCERFSVYTPFFHSVGESAAAGCTGIDTPECQHDPDPYVLIETHDASGIPEDIAIFGVVDPAIGANVGLLNFAWANTTSKDKFASETEVTDPAEPLQQQLDSFDRSFDEKGFSQEVAAGKRWLIKVLIAQMNPQEAQVLGTRLKDFQVIVTAADEELATVGNTENTEWLAPGAGSVRHPMMLEIPEPYFVGGRNPKAVDDVGRLDIRIVPAADPKWDLFSTHMELSKPPDQPTPANTAAAFWKAVETAIQRDCRLPLGSASPSRTEEIEVLTLCEMQKRTHADVAILQERDFFAALPPDAGDIPDLGTGTPENVLQQLLDRIIWKGDFLQLLNVPGSALEDAMKQSKAFDAADRSNLSLAEHKQRGLVYVGVNFDAAHGEYLVDGVKLNPTQLYSVATSDFIGGGDTGYPDFAAAQMHAPMVPTDFEKTLVTITGAVCQGLAGSQWQAHCTAPIDRDTYLDEVAATPTNTGPAQTPGETLRTWWIFHHPHVVPGIFGGPGTLTLVSQATQVVEFRPIWDFRVIRATFAWSGLGHGGSNAEIDSEFGGITTPGVNSHSFDNWTSYFNAQYDRNWQNVQFFAAPSYMFNVQYKGESNAPTQLNQVANLAYYDMGFARLWAQRGPEHRDLVATLHFETPFQETNTVFALKSTVPASLIFDQPRSYTVMARAGFRWQRRVSSVEFGPEGGNAWNALEGFDFLTAGKLTAACPAQSTLSFATCVANFSNPKKTSPPTITAASLVRSELGDRPHAGMYWKINLTVPLYTRVSYVFTDLGDWFFVNFPEENTTDTLFRDIEQHQVRFTIFPSLTIGPEVDFLFYENKSEGPLKGNFLRQDQVLLNAQFSFDLFNVRRKRDQIEYAPTKAAAQ